MTAFTVLMSLFLGLVIIFAMSLISPENRMLIGDLFESIIKRIKGQRALNFLKKKDIKSVIFYRGYLYDKSESSMFTELGYYKNQIPLAKVLDDSINKDASYSVSLYKLTCLENVDYLNLNDRKNLSKEIEKQIFGSDFSDNNVRSDFVAFDSYTNEDAYKLAKKIFTIQEKWDNYLNSLSNKNNIDESVEKVFDEEFRKTLDELAKEVAKDKDKSREKDVQAGFDAVHDLLKEQNN